jgi:hypothetical protein
MTNHPMSEIMSDLIIRAEERQRQALEILERLDLFRRWARFGSPVLVGAVRYGLAVKRDIDMEVYGDNPRIEHGFEVMAQVACLPGIWKVRFSNELASPDQGLYWGLRYRDETGEIWKIDSWYIGHDHPHAHWVEKFAAALDRTLTPETRRAILEIKEAVQEETGTHGIDIYRAVLVGGVRSKDEFTVWIQAHPLPGIQLWLP